MAKSVNVSVLLLLATLAAAVSIDAAGRAPVITVAGGAELVAGIGPRIDRLVKDHPGTFAYPSELAEKIDDFGDRVETLIQVYNDAHKQSKTTLPQDCYYFPLTAIEVDGHTLGGGSSSVLLLGSIPFLSKQAYKQLEAELLKKQELTAVDAPTELGLKFHQLCYDEPAEKLPVIMLAPALTKPLKNFWYKQGDGLPTCLAILS